MTPTPSTDPARTPTPTPSSLLAEGMTSGDRLAFFSDLMREISRYTDPQEMVGVYSERMRSRARFDRLVAISRRGLESPRVRVTRSDTWEVERDPWIHADSLPVFDRGVLSDLIWGGEGRVIAPFELPADDPAAEYLEGMRGLMAIPTYDEGEALNMTLFLTRSPEAVSPEELPEFVWTSNLFGRATKSLVLARQLREANKALDDEMRTIGQIQRSLLPSELPHIETMDLAAHYETSRRAGGDYYDFFQLDNGRWGILIADVCGHGAPAAVLMAIAHALAHTIGVSTTQPEDVLHYVNQRLATGYTAESGTFITAFYGVFDPVSRRMTFANAGHPAPRVKRCTDGSVFTLDKPASFPLGIIPDARYERGSVELTKGDQLIFYTDGVTESFDEQGRMFGVERLDQTLENCRLDAQGLIEGVLDALRSFGALHPPNDDRTMLVAKIR